METKTRKMTTATRSIKAAPRVSPLRTMQRRIVPVILCAALGIIAISAIPAAEAPDPVLKRQFEEVVTPFVAQYCIGCHSGETPASQFNLAAYSTMEDVVEDHPHWALVLRRLKAGEMPPAVMPQPPSETRQRVIGWIEAMRADEARRNAGDPGPVLTRRLSNSEYNYTIRDLTGVDIRPTREFPIDPANLAGFDNSGESLTMSPSLLTKYLKAAREVTDHMVLKPDGFDFAPYLMLVETDREKYAIQRIVNFYKSQPTDYADYFEAAWRFKHRASLGQPRATLASTATDAGVSAKYLPMIWEIIEEPRLTANPEVGPIAKLRALWRALPAPSENRPDVARDRFVEIRDFVIRIREHTGMQFAAPVVKGLPAGSQPLLNWKLGNFAAHRRDSDPEALRNDTDPAPAPPEIPPYPRLHREGAFRWAAIIQRSRAGDPDLVVPAAQRARYQASFARFASVFPDAFYISERGRYFPDDSNDKGRFLSAGYHNVMGYFRDDTALKELILDEKGIEDIDRLWDEFDFIGDYTGRTWDQFYFNQSGAVRGQGAESGTERPTDGDVRATSVILELRDAYLVKTQEDPQNDPIAREAIRVHFKSVDDTLRRIERMRVDAEPHHLEALQEFAARAYRRPLTRAESEGLWTYYRDLREEGELAHEEAMRDSIASILISPDFCYRLDLVESFAQADSRGAAPQADAGTPAGAARRPLSGHALASRLSYFLWSSMPDEELLSHAASGDLQKTEVLVEQVRRMMEDERVRGLATEFAGNWLEFRHFQNHNAVDRERFPVFDDALRQVMFEEPVRLLEDALRNNRSVLDLLYGDYTFVNPALARHYGIPGVDGDERAWVRVDNARRFQRGGLLPMSVFLTHNSPGLRTSPVKRGYWVVRRVLGERIPPPPPVVPELPNDEAKMDLPLRDMLAQHRENPACASCHARFDGFGLAFEGYGPVGERRNEDLAGRPVDTEAVFPDGGQGTGFEGVLTYIHEHRENDYLENLSRKILAYALSRSLLLSDEPIVQRMQANLTEDGYRFGSLVMTVVTSPQFLNGRVSASPEEVDSPRRKGE